MSEKPKQLPLEQRVDHRNTKDIFPNAVAVIDYAFTIDGIDYFEFADFNNISSDRGFNCLSYWEELRSRCSKEYLLTWVQACEDTINSEVVKLTDLIKLFLQVKERLQWLSEPEIAYKLCSVVYFTSAENPNRFDYDTARKKAVIFMDYDKKQDNWAFFLQTPITKLIPHLNLSANDLKEYLEMVSLVNQKHIQDISTMLSEQSKSNEFYKRLISQVEKDLV